VPAYSNSLNYDKKFYRLFLLTLIGLLLLITLLVVPAVYFFEQQLVTSTIDKEEVNLRHTKNIVSEGIGEALADIEKLAHMAIESSLLSTEKDDLDSIAQLFLLIARNQNDRYAQLRYIDNNGDERVRIDSSSGYTLAVSSEQLQNKGDRYYFKQTMSTPKGGFFVSPFDLNIEYGQIAKPYQPMLRLAVPLDMEDGSRKGIFILNYDGRELLEKIKTSNVIGGISTSQLVNSDGFWILGESADQEWGFLLNRPEENLAIVNPGLWQHLNSATEGVYQDSEALYLFDTFNPFDDLFDRRFNAPSRVNLQTTDTRVGALKLLYKIATPVLYRNSFVNQPSGWLLLAFIYLLMGVIAWILTAVRRNREQAEEYDFSITQKREEEFRSYLESAPDGIVVCDRKGLILRVNKHSEDLFGYDRDELIGQPVEILIPAEFRKSHPDERNTYVSSPSAREMGVGLDIYGVRKDGSEFPADISLNFIETLNETHVIAAVRDKTKLKHIEDQLQIAKDTAEKASRLKTDFLANMSHEIRTPLNAVIGTVYLLRKDSELAPSLKPKVHSIDTAAQSLLSIVNDILDLSKIEAGEFALEMVPMQLSSLLLDVEAIFGPKAKELGLDLIISDLPSSVTNNVIADQTRIRQILFNIISNALKFTPDGHILLKVEALFPPPKKFGDRSLQTLSFEITDTGIGIEPDVVPKLFEAFKQADTSTTRNFGGTGLGLSIVKELCEAMNGSVSVKSETGHGSTFTVEIPLVLATDNEMEAAGLLVKPLEVLIAEDNPDHLSTLIKMCQKLGWKTDFVKDGQSLVDRVIERNNLKNPVQCLIVDWQMPKLDGLQAIQKIQQLQAPDRTPGALMVTSHDLQRLEDSQYADIPDSILQKPVSMSSLYNQVNKAFMHRFGREHDLVSSSHFKSDDLKWLTDVTILLVDDSDINVEIASSILKREGAQIFSCSNGREAIDWIHENEQPIDLILMDVQMPVMDGNSATREIRKIDRFADLPIIALTAGALVSERAKSIEAGMTDYLTKPFDPERMIRLIRHQLDINGRKAVPVVARDPTAHSSQLWPLIPGIDLQAVKDRTANDLAFFGRVLQRFIDDNRGLEDVDTFIESFQNDVDQSRRWAHKLAGNAGLIGANDILELAKSLERLLAEGKLQEASQLLSTLSEHYRELVKASSDFIHSLRVPDPSPQQAASATQSLKQTELEALCHALENHQFAAVGQFRTLADALAAEMSHHTFTELTAAIDSFNFSQAHSLLKPLLRRG